MEKKQLLVEGIPAFGVFVFGARRVVLVDIDIE